MLHLGSTYLIVKDMQKSLDFYEKLLGIKPAAKNFNRWAQFNFDGKCIALYSNEFDFEMIKNNQNLSFAPQKWMLLIFYIVPQTQQNQDLFHIPISIFMLTY